MTTPAGDGTYWFVRVAGLEDDRGSVMISCDRAFLFHVDTASRRLAYDPTVYPYDARLVDSLVAYDVDKYGGCALANELQPNLVSETMELGVLGNLRVQVDPNSGDATVFLQGVPHVVAPGQQLRFTGEGERHENGLSWKAHADVLIVNHGAWPQSGLQTLEDSGLF
ncbi:MAG TPA: hypothetical protein VM327_08705 [Candidatus Thermoplasmatota archaeon]|nr:hypothetical protein [Candidatus Thermoplasmatota archaeon]